MAKQQKRVMVSHIWEGQDSLRVLATPGDFDQIKDIDGVSRICMFDSVSGIVHTDPRYDILEIVLEIEKLNDVQTLEQLLAQ